MNDKSFSSSKALASKSDNARPGSVKFQRNGEHSFPKNLHPQSESTRQSSAREAKFAEFENETIQKQRQEMQLLIMELRSRDRELNDMVTGHRKQLTAWEQDRTRIAALEQKCSRYERELHGRDEEIYGLTAKLRAIDSEEESRQMALRNMQDQLSSVTEQHCLTSQRLNEAQEVGRGLARTIKELKSAAGQHEQTEQELYQLLSSKDRDLSEAASHIAEISAKLKRSEFQQQELQQVNVDLRRQASEWRNKCAELNRELDHVKKQNAKLEEFSAKQKTDIQQLRQQLIIARSEITMSNEREQRKEELLQLQKSKHDRTEAELTALRELSEIQQRDLSLLQSSLDTAKNLLNCRQNRDRGSANYSRSSQMLLASQPVSPSFGDSPIRSYLKKSSSHTAWKDTDAADSNVNNHANMSRYSVLRDAESPKVNNWSNHSFSIPFSPEQKAYDWEGDRSVEDPPEKQLTVELDESPTKDVISSDLEKEVKAANGILRRDLLESRVESSSNLPGSAYLALPHVTSPWEGLSASTRTHSVLSPHGSLLIQKTRSVTSTERLSSGSSIIAEESEDDVVRDEVSMSYEENAEGDGMLVGEESKVEGRKQGSQDHWKREVYMENEVSRLKMNSAIHVTALREEKSLGMSSVTKEASLSKERCAENRGALTRDRDPANSGGSVISNPDSLGNYATKLSSAKDDHDGSRQADICASNYSATKDEDGFQSGKYCPPKNSSSKDEDVSQSRGYNSSKFSSSTDDGSFQSEYSSPSKLSSTKVEGGFQSGHSSPSKLSSTKDEGASQSGNYCPSKDSSSKDDHSFQSGNYCPSRLSSTKDESGFQSENYSVPKLSSSKNEGDSLSRHSSPSNLSSTKDEGDSKSVNYCPSKFSSSKDDGGSESRHYLPSNLSSTKDNDGSRSEIYHSCRMFEETEEGGSRSLTPKLSATVDEKSNVNALSLSEGYSDPQLQKNNFSPSSPLPSLESAHDSMSNCDGNPELENRSRLKISIITGDSDPELEKTCPSRASSLSSVSQYSLQSLPANYGSSRKPGEAKFQIPSCRSGHWSGSCEKLSEAVGKDWARSYTWNSTTGEPTDNSAFRQMSSFIGGVGRVVDQRNTKVDLRAGSETVVSGGRGTLQHEDFGSERFLKEQRNLEVEIMVQGKYSGQSSGTISESSSHMDVFSDALTGLST